MTFRVRNAEGGYRWFLSRAEPLRASDGTLQYWIGINLDIDERKQAEFYLAEGQRFAHAGSWAFNSAGFQYWTPKLFAIHGLDPERGARDVVINSSDFVAFILACELGRLPFLHQIHYGDHVPEHLYLSDKDSAALAANPVGPLQPDAQKAVRKMSKCSKIGGIWSDTSSIFQTYRSGTSFNLISGILNMNRRTIGWVGRTFTLST